MNQEIQPYSRDLEVYRQDWEQEIASISRQLHRGKEISIVPGRMMVFPFALLMGLACIRLFPPAGMMFLLVAFFLGVSGSAALGYQKKVLPARRRRIKLPKPDVITTSLTTASNGQVLAAISKNKVLSKTIVLGRENQEEIAQNYFLLEQAVEAINAFNKQGMSKSLLERYNITSRGKIADTSNVAVRKAIGQSVPSLNALPLAQSINDEDGQYLQSNQQLVASLQKNQ